ncbi:MAG: response regulator, partial [Chloroflexota bacterium]
MTEQPGESSRPTVLCVDDDHDVAAMIEAILVDEGYDIRFLYDHADDALLRTVGSVEPDVILLDSASPGHFGESWASAAAVATRSRPISVIMFSAHARDIEEAQEGETERARAAKFAAVIPKPFHLDELLDAVATAAGRSTPFDRSSAAESRRTRELVGALEARGATDIRPSKMREWALFRDRHGALLQLYWWQQRGVYQVGRYRRSGQLVMLGQYVDR